MPGRGGDSARVTLGPDKAMGVGYIDGKRRDVAVFSAPGSCRIWVSENLEAEQDHVYMGEATYTSTRHRIPKGLGRCQPR